MPRQESVLSFIQEVRWEATCCCNGAAHLTYGSARPDPGAQARWLATRSALTGSSWPPSWGASACAPTPWTPSVTATSWRRRCSRRRCTSCTCPGGRRTSSSTAPASTGSCSVATPTPQVCRRSRGPPSCVCHWRTNLAGPPMGLTTQPGFVAAAVRASSCHLPAGR